MRTRAGRARPSGIRTRTTSASASPTGSSGALSARGGRGPRLQRYSGFETGLRTSRGRKKPAYNGFMLPLAVKQYGASDVLWGRVRPATGPTQVTIQHKLGGGRWKRLTVVPTSGVYGFRADHKVRQLYRVKWRRPGGGTIVGP